MAKKSVVRSQMGATAPSTAGISQNAHQYGCPPFSEHKHDDGNGGIPTTVRVDVGGKMPSNKSAAFTSATGPAVAPSPGTRRFGRSK